MTNDVSENKERGGFGILKGKIKMSEDFDEPLEFIESKLLDELDEVYSKCSNVQSLSESESKKLLGLIRQILSKREPNLPKL
jgi:hypothetical protein